jgi:predicted Holliday junction resolvase-like endonuclease
MDINFTAVGFIVLGIVIAYLIGRLHAKPKHQLPDDFQSNLTENSLIDLYKKVDTLPLRVLQTIQGSINPQKGKMAELLTYAELRYDYDRIIPLGWPIDFIGIRNNDRIDFIEVKSGNSALLTDEEKHIKNLIASGNVHFRLIKVTEDEVSRFVSARSSQ